MTIRTVSTRSWVSIPLATLQHCAGIIEARLDDGTSMDEDYDRDVLIDARIEIADRLRAIARGQEADQVLARDLHRRREAAREAVS